VGLAHPPGRVRRGDRPPVSPDELARKCAHVLVPRPTNRYGCVTWQRDHCSGAQGAPQTPVWLWVYGNAVRVVYDNVLLAAYHGHDDRRTGKVTDIRDGTFYPTRFASCPQQGSLIPFTPQASLVLYRPPWRRRACPGPAEQLGLLAELKRT
jgi:hypothetical protein